MNSLFRDICDEKTSNILRQGTKCPIVGKPDGNMGYKCQFKFVDVTQNDENLPGVILFSLLCASVCIYSIGDPSCLICHFLTMLVDP